MPGVFYRTGLDDKDYSETLIKNHIAEMFLDKREAFCSNIEKSFAKQL
jgi:hypothetical protein